MLERYVSNRKVAPDFEQIYTVEQKGGLRLVNILEKIRCFKTKLIFDLIHREKSWEPFGKYWLGLFLRKHEKRFRTNTYLFELRPNKFYASARDDYTEILKMIPQVQKICV